MDEIVGVRSHSVTIRPVTARSNKFADVNASGFSSPIFGTGLAVVSSSSTVFLPPATDDPFGVSPAARSPTVGPGAGISPPFQCRSFGDERAHREIRATFAFDSSLGRLG